MKFINTPNFKAKNNKEYSFQLVVNSHDNEDCDYYSVNVFDEQKNKVGELTLSNLIEEKYNKIYENEKFGDIKFIENRQIANTGLFINDEGELKIENKDYFISFYEEFLFLENVKIKNEESLNNFLSELSDFLIPEKKVVYNKINKPEIISVYLLDGTDQSEDLRGLGIGKKLYTYASQWMGLNNLKVHTQNVRTKDAFNLWQGLKNDPSFHYEKHIDGNDSIFRVDGCELDNTVENIILQKMQKQVITKSVKLKP